MHASPYYPAKMPVNRIEDWRKMACSAVRGSPKQGRFSTTTSISSRAGAFAVCCIVARRPGIATIFALSFAFIAALLAQWAVELRSEALDRCKAGAHVF